QVVLQQGEGRVLVEVGPPTRLDPSRLRFVSGIPVRETGPVARISKRGSNVDGERLRAVMRRLPSPVTVVTVQGEREMRGITIGSFTSTSLDPPLISFNVEQAAQMHDFLVGATHYAVHLLGVDQAHLSDHFAMPERTGAEQFASVAFHRDARGTPVLDDVLAVLHCTHYAVYEAGDHSIFVGEVVEV